MAPYSISAGCDFLCVLTTSGALGVYEHSSEQLSSYADLDTNGLDLDAARDSERCAR